MAGGHPTNAGPREPAIHGIEWWANRRTGDQGCDGRGPIRVAPGAEVASALVPGPLVVQKYGGTSVGDADRIRAVADHVARTQREGKDVVVVVSAMGKTTDDLIRLAGEVSSVQPPREYDMLVSAGERISTALLCMALADLGVAAASFTGSQAGIVTDTDHTKAKIVEIRATRLTEALQEGRVPVVAGFQGVSTERDVTTLGRGASDLTAVALAAVLGAEACEIYTDVTGVFSADPRVVPVAHRLGRVSFEEMLEIAAAGGRVLQLRSAEFARNHHVPLQVRSSFTWEPGTWVVEEDASMEQAVVTAVIHTTAQAKVTVSGVRDRPGIAARLFRALADRSINVDDVVQNTSVHGMTDISFTVPRTDLQTAVDVAEGLSGELGATGVHSDAGVAKVSVIGAGMKSHPGVTATMFETLAGEGINIDMIATSTIRISCVVRAEDVERAVRALHGVFELA
jgi:aspartate kinase